MNRSSLMLAALEDGDWHARRDLFNHACTFYLTNNAASELRALGFDVEQRYFEGNYEYRLLSDRRVIPSTLPIAEQVASRGSLSPAACSPPEQLRLVA